MSTKLPVRPPKMEHHVSTPKIAIVASEYNPEFVQGLINNACNEIYHIDERSVIELFSAPGSFEIPVVVAMIAGQQRHDVIIALGVLLQGKTRHADIVATSVAHALQTVALQYVVPVINEVLLVGSEEEARERCLGTDLNRGIEDARATFGMIRSKSRIQQQPGRRPLK